MLRLRKQVWQRSLPNQFKREKLLDLNLLKLKHVFGSTSKLKQKYLVNCQTPSSKQLPEVRVSRITKEITVEAR